MLYRTHACTTPPALGSSHLAGPPLSKENRANASTANCKKMMKISVVTAVFNRANTIADAMASIQSQSYSRVEHIVQDGGSTDGTLDEIARLTTEKTNVISERDSGLYDAINRGISRATGEVIGLMHSDDFFAHEEVLGKVSIAFSDPAIHGVYGDLQYVSATNPSRVIRHWRSGKYDPLLLKHGWMPPHPTLYLRREVFERFGLYDPSFSISADYDAILRYLFQGKLTLAYIPEVLVKMRHGGESNRSLERIFKKSIEDYRAIRKNRVGGFGTLTAKNLSKIGQFFI